MTSVPHSGAKSVTPGGSVAGHTPGPWEVVRTNARGQQDADGETLWVYAGGGNGWVGESYMSALLGSGNGAEANARLIAAAPELLAAVWSLVEHFERVDGDEHHKAVIAIGTSAISKATAGETRNAEPVHRRDGDAA